MAKKDELIKAAIGELGINKPIMATKMVGGRLDLYLYGGEVVSYQPTASKKKPAVKTEAAKKSTSASNKSTSK